MLGVVDLQIGCMVEIPRCLVYFNKISAYDSLWFRSYKSWSEVCSKGIWIRAANFGIFVQGLPATKRGDSFFIGSPNMFTFIMKFLSGFLDDYVKGFKTETVKGLKLGIKQGTLF